MHTRVILFGWALPARSPWRERTKPAEAAFLRVIFQVVGRNRHRALRQLSFALLSLAQLITAAAASPQSTFPQQNQDSSVASSSSTNSGPANPAAEFQQNVQPALSLDNDSWILRKRVDEVTVFFTATDGHKFVPGLTPENVRVWDDNKPVAKISAFGYQRDLPLRLGLLVDTSSSVNPQFRAQQRAAIQFLHQIIRPGVDLAFVLGFANEADITQDYSDNGELLAAGVMSLHNGGGTALFDAIYNACDKMTVATDKEATARILIVLSDGDDNESKTTLSRVIEKAQMREVTIYTMNTSDEYFERKSAPEHLVLKRLAVETGGGAFESAEKREVVKAFSAIEEEMRNRYALSYQPSQLKEDGRFHNIKIDAQKSGRRVHVHTRKGYYARLISTVE